MEEEKLPSIPSIDEDLAHMSQRLFTLLDHLKSASNGETVLPNDVSDEKMSIPSASLESISQRMNDMRTTMTTIETFTKRFHS